MKNLKIGDICLIVGIPMLALVLIVCFFLFSRAGDVAIVTVDDQEICRLPLDKDTSLMINGGSHEIVVENGQVTIKNATCEDKVCENYPPISQVGQSIVCLPYHLVVWIEEGDT